MGLKKTIFPMCILLSIVTSSIVLPHTQNSLGINLVHATPNRGNTLYVGGSGVHNYTTLQSAINNAKTGDTVFVYKGIYYENIIVNKTISLKGENKNSTIITGNKSANIVTIVADEIKLSGFTITTYKNDPDDLLSSSFNYTNPHKGNAITYKNNSGIYIYKSGNNIIKENIVTNNTLYGIQLDSSSTNNTITRNTVTDNTHYGIKIDSSSNNNTIKENTITYNNWYGLYLESFSNYIAGNIITNNDDGISLRSFKNVIVGNTITSNGNGIYLYIGIPPPYDRGAIKGNTIMGNTITKNSNGVYLYFNSHCSYCKDHAKTANTLTGNIITHNTKGINLISSPNNTITGNIITHNTHGIELSLSSNNNNLTGNIISHNSNGIDLDQSSNNIIYHNNFINNSLQLTTSSGGINKWDNGFPYGGNYWDTYTGVDSDGDHIGDTPYIIYGGFNRDRYPLMIPYDVILNQPPTCALSVNISSGATPLLVIFTMTASDPDGFISSWILDIDNDRTPEYSDSGTSSSIVKHIYHKPGTYTAKLMVTDNEWATASATQVIKINQQDKDGEDIPGFEFTLMILVLLSVLFMSQRKRQHGFK